MVSKYNKRERFNTDEETWPPDQPQNFTPLLLIHHQGQHSIKQATAMAEVIQTGNIYKITSLASNQEISNRFKVDSHEPLKEVLGKDIITKEFTDILVQLEQSKDPQFILIEGAPGIGKSFLLKEIAYRWGNKKQLLKTFKLVLLVCLRDPTIQQVVSVSDLLQHFCEGNRQAIEIAAACHDYLFENDGKDIAFLLDGFDEFPSELQKSGLIAKILKRRLLPNCAVIISSRPHATAHLREQATVRVDILGFTEIERNQFIQQALQDQPQSIKELTQYLDNHFTISSLCVVPFNMVVLLFLYKQGISLPNNSTELYKHFICLTICKHLARHGYDLDNKITDLTNLPDPCNKVVQQLSKLSLEALNNSKLVFTFDEIEAACPNIKDIPGAINGFGLLQAVQHFGITGKTITFNFVHLYIQEFLAAYHVTCLSPSDELLILKEKFWSGSHSNMFAIYMTLTKGQSGSFKQFIKPSFGQWIKGLFWCEKVIISDRFLDTHLKCLQLFQCFYEADDQESCRYIDKLFDSRVIYLKNIWLSPSDVERVILFLNCSSYKEWKKLDLQHCYIQDHGVHILHHGLTSVNVTITTMLLGYNGLSESSFSAISKVTIHCKVKVLDISGNETIGKNARLYSLLSDPHSMLEELHMVFTKLSSIAASELFTALRGSKKLKILRISFNDITDKACDDIVKAMKMNTSLVELGMSYNQISGECAQLIVEAIQQNNTLQQIGLANDYPQEVWNRIKLAAEEVNKERKSRECQVKFTVFNLN